MDIKKILESGNVESILGSLKENNTKSFTSLFKNLRENNIFVSYYDSRLYISSNNQFSLTESLKEIRSILKESKVDLINISEVKNSQICFEMELTLLNKDVERYCNERR